MPRRQGEALVDDTLGLGVGDEVELAGRSVTVVGVIRDTTFYFGMPTVFLPIADVQDALLAGQPVASTIVTRGIPTELPAGLRSMTGAEVERDLRRPLAQPAQTLDMINGLLWLVAAGVIGSIVYVSVLERLRDVAVMKATGTSSARLSWGLALQSISVSTVSGTVAAGLAVVIAPGFPMPVELTAGGLGRMVVVSIAVGHLGHRLHTGRVPAP